MPNSLGISFPLNRASEGNGAGGALADRLELVGYLMTSVFIKALKMAFSAA